MASVKVGASAAGGGGLARQPRLERFGLGHGQFDRRSGPLAHVGAVPRPGSGLGDMTKKGTDLTQTLRGELGVRLQEPAMKFRPVRGELLGAAVERPGPGVAWPTRAGAAAK